MSQYHETSRKKHGPIGRTEEKVLLGRTYFKNIPIIQSTFREIHLLNMTKHSLGLYSGAVCPPPLTVANLKSFEYSVEYLQAANNITYSTVSENSTSNFVPLRSVKLCCN